MPRDFHLSKLYVGWLHAAMMKNLGPATGSLVETCAQSVFAPLVFDVAVSFRLAITLRFSRVNSMRKPCPRLGSMRGVSHPAPVTAAVMSLPPNSSSKYRAVHP